MVVSWVPTHLSREMSDYAWPLRHAVPPAVAICTAKSRLPPLNSLSHSLEPFQRYTPVCLHCCSTLIYYTSIVMKTYLIHNVYCSRKMACQRKEQTIIVALREKHQRTRVEHVQLDHLLLFEATGRSTRPADLAWNDDIPTAFYSRKTKRLRWKR